VKTADKITGSEIKIMRTIAKYNWMDYKREEDFVNNGKRSLH
jgi:hypothetical protein